MARLFEPKEPYQNPDYPAGVTEKDIDNLCISEDEEGYDDANG